MEIEELVKKIEETYATEKGKECMELYNALVEVITEKRASIQNILFVLKMIEWSLLRAKYMELVEKAVVIPEGSVPLKAAGK